MGELQQGLLRGSHLQELSSGVNLPQELSSGVNLSQELSSGYKRGAVLMLTVPFLPGCGSEKGKKKDFFVSTHYL